MSQMIGQTWEEEVLEQGKAAGELRALRGVLRKLLTKRFGALPEDVARKIDQTEDVARLNACIEDILQLASLQDLRL